MKFLTKIVIPIFFTAITVSCYSQQMVQSQQDAKKLEINKEQFIGKPLKDLLKEIKPKIKTALGAPGSSELPSFFNFYFTAKKDYDKYRAKNKFPLTIKVYVKGTFEWDKRGKTKDNWLDWTKQDEERYGDLIIADVKVYNK